VVWEEKRAEFVRKDAIPRFQVGPPSGRPAREVYRPLEAFQELLSVKTAQAKRSPAGHNVGTRLERESHVSNCCTVRQRGAERGRNDEGGVRIALFSIEDRCWLHTDDTRITAAARKDMKKRHGHFAEHSVQYAVHQIPAAANVSDIPGFWRRTWTDTAALRPVSANRRNSGPIRP